MAAAALMFAGLGFAQPAASQSATPAEIEVRRAQLLQMMLERPDDLDLAFSYAALSAQAGDFEGAIATLERMLIYAPGLPRVQLELGVLYYRLGAFDVARQYFEAAVSGPDVPDLVRERVDVYLAGIDQAEDPTKISGALIVGARWQSNANAAPGDRNVTLNNTTFLLGDNAVSQSDFNAYLAATAHVSYDLASQGDLLEADLLLYGARYAELSRLHTELAEITFGPSFNMARFNWQNARLGIYGIVGGVRLDNANYSGTLGAGVKLAVLPSIRSKIETKNEFRWRWFNDTATYQTVSQRNGYRLSTNFAYTYLLTGSIAVRASVFGARENAAAIWEDYLEGGAAIGATKRFKSPFEHIEQPWSVDLDGGVLLRAYDEADPTINAAATQSDTEFWVRSTLTMPVIEDWAVLLTGEFRRAISNYPTDDYSNASVSASVLKKF